jgi:hypothetical protein
MNRNLAANRLHVGGFLFLLASIGLWLSACDGASGATSGGGAAVAGHPAGLVGSWVARPNEYSVAHMVLRADGSGTTVGEQGSRRDVGGLSGSADDSTLFLNRVGSVESKTLWSVRHDSLWIVSGWGTPRRDTTGIFVRETEPSLAAAAGVVEPKMVGAWKGQAPRVSDKYEGFLLVGHDTAWEPETFGFAADGTGSSVTFDDQNVKDSVSGEWSNAWVPIDTARFTWWIGGKYLYLSMWNPSAKPPSAASVTGTQVTQWGFEGDSLLITKLWGTPIAKRLGRMR